MSATITKKIYVQTDVGSDTERELQEYLLDGWTVLVALPVFTYRTVASQSVLYEVILNKEETDAEEHEEFEEARESTNG